MRTPHRLSGAAQRKQTSPVSMSPENGADVHRAAERALGPRGSDMAEADQLISLSASADKACQPKLSIWPTFALCATVGNLRREESEGWRGRRGSNPRPPA